MGIGVALYFRFLRFLIGLLSILTILSIPALLFTTSGFGMGSYTDTVGWSYGMIGNIGFPCEPLSGIAKNVLGCSSTNTTLNLLVPGEKVGPNVVTHLVTHGNEQIYPYCFCGLYLRICLNSSILTMHVKIFIRVLLITVHPIIISYHLSRCQDVYGTKCNIPSEQNVYGMCISVLHIRYTQTFDSKLLFMNRVNASHTCANIDPSH